MQGLAELPYADQHVSQAIRAEAQNFRLLRRDLGPRMMDLEAMPVIKRFLFDFRTEGEKRSIAEGIHNSKRLNKRTHVHSFYERMFVKPLLKNFGEVLFEPLRLPVLIEEKKFKKVLEKMDMAFADCIDRRKDLIELYTTDFWLPFHYIGDRSIVIEPHGSRFMSSEYLKKLGRVRERYGLYIVLATMPNYNRASEIGAATVRANVDELWCISKDYPGKMELKSNVRDLMRRAESRPVSSIEVALEKLRMKMPEMKAKCDDFTVC